MVEGLKQSREFVRKDEPTTRDELKTFERLRDLGI